ncbi:MAG TPA: hypothetical protein ENJ32_02895 [Crenotrichaceae bacterium]|nr:hypothetical protein [Crenotrichaceae bacterium]
MSVSLYNQISQTADARQHKLLLILPIIFLIISKNVHSEWNAEVDTSMYHTDDIGLFSVTRRLSLLEDPTQPVVDRPDQGSDFIYEPNAELTWSNHNSLGEFEAGVDVGGYVFIDHSDYTHGFYQLQIGQTFFTGTEIKFAYEYVPDLFLGKNDILSGESEQEGENEELFSERLTSHVWTIHINQHMTEQLTFRLLGRYGLRNYDAPFQYRDINFWTVGPHLEWEIAPGYELLIGYHYERGYTNKHNARQLLDDISYINHFTSAELKIHLLEKLSAILTFDYEHNTFTSNFDEDIHSSASENIYQGEIELLYELNRETTIKAGWQHGNRKFNFENKAVRNNNLWLGIEYGFSL